MKHLPNDLKTVKMHIHAWRLFARIARTAFVAAAILGVLCVIGSIVLFILAVSALPDHWHGRNPLPPAAPCLRNARTDCIRNVTSLMRRRRFEARQGDSICFYAYSDIDVTIEQEYDFDPYYVFCGRVRMSDPDLPLSYLQNDIVSPVLQTGFFFVNRFNPSEAKHYRGKGYFPEHYNMVCLNSGLDRSRQEQKNK